MKKTGAAGAGGRERQRNRKYGEGETGGRGRPVWTGYALASALCLLFSLVYSLFSHQIDSPWMRFLFLWPLLPGGIPALLQERGLIPPYPVRSPDGRDGDREQDEEETEETQGLGIGELMQDLYRFGIAALTAASLLKGILEIAGTDSVYPDFLLAAGAAMTAAGALYYIFSIFSGRAGRRQRL